MKFLVIFMALTIGWSTQGHTAKKDFLAQYVKPIVIEIISRDEKGVLRKENLPCTPQTCCFSEESYCFMENGHCVCDINRCEMWPSKKDTKIYWMKISGTEAERFCGRPRLLHKLTQICRCNPEKIPMCEQCNPPPPECIPGPRIPKSCCDDC
jgi:hypothetical protein